MGCVQQLMVAEMLSARPSCFLVAPIVSLTLSVFCSPPFHILFDVLAYLANILFHPCTRDTFLCSSLSLGRTKSCLFYVMCDWGVDEMFVHCPKPTFEYRTFETCQVCGNKLPNYLTQRKRSKSY